MFGLVRYAWFDLSGSVWLICLVWFGFVWLACLVCWSMLGLVGLVDLFWSGLTWFGWLAWSGLVFLVWLIWLLFLKITHFGDRYFGDFLVFGVIFLMKLRSGGLLFQEKWPDRFFKPSKWPTQSVPPLQEHGFGFIFGGFWEPKSISFEEKINQKLDVDFVWLRK